VDKRLSNEPVFSCRILEVAVDPHLRAVLSGEKVAVYGDFDADGITSTACLGQVCGF